MSPLPPASGISALSEKLSAGDPADAPGARPVAPARDAPPRRKAEEKDGQPVRAEQARPGKGPRNPWLFQRLEEAIIALEERRTQLLGALASEEVYKDAQRARSVQVELSEAERDLARKNEEWEAWA
jgi:hypothetical protein